MGVGVCGRLDVVGWALGAQSSDVTWLTHSMHTTSIFLLLFPLHKWISVASAYASDYPPCSDSHVPSETPDRAIKLVLKIQQHGILYCLKIYTKRIAPELSKMNLFFQVGESIRGGHAKGHDLGIPNARFRVSAKKEVLQHRIIPRIGSFLP